MRATIRLDAQRVIDDLNTISDDEWAAIGPHTQRLISTAASIATLSMASTHTTVDILSSSEHVADDAEDHFVEVSVFKAKGE